jgi:hypothetical protein
MFNWIWLPDLTTYYLCLERLAILSLALLVLAFVSFGMLAISFELKAALFVVYSVALFNIESIMDRLFGKTTLTAKDKAIIEEIRSSGLTRDEQKTMYRERIPSRSWQVPAVIVLIWFLLLSLLITLGGARYLAQFSAVQELASLIPSDIFLKDGAQRSGHDILLLKIFKIVHVFSLPFVAWAVCVLSMPFWKNPKTFPISPMAIYRDEERATFQKIRRSLWTILAFFILFFGIVAFPVYMVVSGYTSRDCTGLSFCEEAFGRVLDIRMWFRLNGYSVVCGILLSAFIKIVVDCFSLIVILFKKVRGI